MASSADSVHLFLTVALLLVLVLVGGVPSWRLSRPATAACLCDPGAGSQHPTSCKYLAPKANICVVPYGGSNSYVIVVSACRPRNPSVSGSGEDGNI